MFTKAFTQVTLTSQHTSSTVSFLLQCMDVEPNPGPQHINISDLPTPSKLLFNQAKRTRLKLTRYQSHTINLLAYTNNNLIANGLTPKCTPAIHSNNPSFWNKWQENLDILAQLQLDLLLKETNNNVTQFAIDLSQTEGGTSHLTKPRFNICRARCYNRNHGFQAPTQPR